MTTENKLPTAEGSPERLVSRIWRVVYDPEEIQQCVENGGRLLCTAVIGGCGPSATAEHSGEFWWHRKKRPGIETARGYARTLEEAKAAVDMPNAELTRLVRQIPRQEK